MAYIKTNENIKTHQDIQNLITGIIFRLQDKTYSIDKIVKLAERYLKGSPVQVSSVRLKQKVEDTLDLFQRYDLVVCQKGVYKTVKTKRWFGAGWSNEAVAEIEIN